MKLTRASSLSPEPIEWLWEGRVPLKSVTILEGDPGVSKSTLTCAMASCISTGTDWPDGKICPLGEVLMCNAEDPEKEVIVPRLIAAGADRTKVSIVGPSDDGVEFTLPDNVKALEDAVAEWGVKLLVIDPLTAYLSIKVAHYNDHHIRQAIRPLASMAKRLNLAVLVVRHLIKDSTKSSKYRGSGSIGIMGAARAAHLVSEDPSQRGSFLMAPNKGNWAAPPATLTYRVESVQLTGENGLAIGTSRICWTGERDLSAADILAPQAEMSDGVDVSDVCEIVRREIARGNCLSDDIAKAAAREGFNVKALFRAAKLIGVIRESVDGKWRWSIREPKDERFIREMRNERG